MQKTMLHILLQTRAGGFFSSEDNGNQNNKTDYKGRVHILVRVMLPRPYGLTKEKAQVFDFGYAGYRRVPTYPQYGRRIKRLIHQ